MKRVLDGESHEKQFKLIPLIKKKSELKLDNTS